MSQSDEDTASTVILVVDDDAPIRANLPEILVFEGYDVLTASSGVEGLHILRAAAHLPRLIISDVLMKPMDGYQFFHAVRADQQWDNIGFIFVSATPGLKDTVTAEYVGTKKPAYLPKPYGIPDLLEIVQRVLSQTEVG